MGIKIFNKVLAEWSSSSQSLFLRLESHQMGNLTFESFSIFILNLFM